MYCGKCGAKNESGATFCGACGAPLGAAKPNSTVIYGEPGAPAGVTKAQGNKHKTIGVAAVVVAMIAIFGVFSLFFGGKGPEATVERFLDAVMESDTETMLALVPPKVLNLVESAGYSKEEYARQLESMTGELGSVAGILESLGGDVKISYKVVDTEDVDADKMRDLKEGYQEEFDMKVKDAKLVEVELRMEGFGQSETGTFTIPVIKSGRTWYLDLT